MSGNLGDCLPRWEIGSTSSRGSKRESRTDGCMVKKTISLKWGNGKSFLFGSNFCLDGLEEVRLKSHLKGWFTYCFVPSKAQDLTGFKDKYITKYGSN